MIWTQQSGGSRPSIGWRAPNQSSSKPWAALAGSQRTEHMHWCVVGSESMCTVLSDLVQDGDYSKLQGGPYCIVSTGCIKGHDAMVRSHSSSCRGTEPRMLGSRSSRRGRWSSFPWTLLSPGPRGGFVYYVLLVVLSVYYYGMSSSRGPGTHSARLARACKPRRPSCPSLSGTALSCHFLFINFELTDLHKS